MYFHEQIGRYYRARVKVVVVGLISSMIAATCQPKLELSPRAFIQALQRLGWTYSDPPRGVLGAGSIVTVTKESGIKYRSALTTCINDADITKVTSTKVGLAGQLSGSATFDISALLGYESVTVGPEFNQLKSFTLTMKDTAEETIDAFKVSDWISAHRGSLSPACTDALLGRAAEVPGDGGYYVLTDVLRVDGYKYTFHDTSGTKVNLSPANLGKYFTLNGKGSYNTTADGDLEVPDGALYIAFQKDVSTKIGSAGAAPVQNAVEIMRARNARVYGTK